MKKSENEMTVGELIEKLKTLDKDMPVIVSSDEEMNMLYKEFVVCRVDVADSKIDGNIACCFFGLSGSELREDKDYQNM